jgi:NADH-quinone oxidoreductase subunit F
MDLKLIGANPTPKERAAIEAAVPGAETVEVSGRVVRTDRSGLRDRLLPALDAVQSAVGFISQGAVDEISRRLHIPPAEIYSVATFYALLSTEPRPEQVAHVCDDTACRAAGGAALLASFGDRDDVVSSPCLGQCDRRPAVLVQRAGEPDVVVTSATAETVSEVLDGAGFDQSEPRVVPGPLLKRVGNVNPGSISDYRAHGGYAALARAIEIGPDAVIAELKSSGLKGRGGAAFPTGVKWEAVRNQSDPTRYVVCNADESEPGTFKDRVLLEGDPFSIIEAMTICGLTVGSELGYLYVRGEYPTAAGRLATALDAARNDGVLGEDVMGSGRRFDIELRRGQGAYICGEETALFNSIEGFRGEPRQKPPFPVQSGLFGKPTVINNVETLANVNLVLTMGGEAYAGVGTADSSGTRLFCLSGDVELPGVYEVEFGATLGELIAMAGGPAGDLGFVMLGGAAGSLVDRAMLDLALTFEDSRAAGVSLGSGVVMVFNTTVDMVDIVRRITRFFRDESCGQCVPCRVGTVRVEEAVARANGSVEATLIEEMDRAMKDASICGLGHTAASVVRSAIALGILGEAR